jgi:hypothetical protein
MRSIEPGMTVSEKSILPERYRAEGLQQCLSSLSPIASIMENTEASE